MAANSILTQNPSKSAVHRSKCDADSTHSMRESIDSTRESGQCARESSHSTWESSRSARESADSTRESSQSARESIDSTRESGQSVPESSHSLGESGRSTSGFDCLSRLLTHDVSKLMTRQRWLGGGADRAELFFLQGGFFCNRDPATGILALKSKLFLIFTAGLNKHNLLQLSHLQHLKIASGMAFAKWPPTNDLS